MSLHSRSAARTAIPTAHGIESMQNLVSANAPFHLAQTDTTNDFTTPPTAQTRRTSSIAFAVQEVAA